MWAGELCKCKEPYTISNHFWFAKINVAGLQVVFATAEKVSCCKTWHREGKKGNH